MASSIVYSLCGMCNTRCPVEIHCENGVPRWICGNSHSASGAALCPRGAASLALYADDERPQGPLIRAGERGAGLWRSVSWDEALDYVAERLKTIMATYGPRSVLWSERPGPFSDMSKALMRGLGSPNYCTHDDACAHNVNQASYSLTGHGRGKWIYDFKNCRHIVVQGRNFLESLKVGELNQVLDALDKGCRLTCVDVRPTVTGLKAQQNLCIRPGTDLALNLAVLHVLIEEKLYDAAYVERYVQDFEALADFVRPYSPQWAESQCDIPADVIAELARSLAAAAPQVIWHGGWMSTRYPQSFMVCRTAYLIDALLGAFGSKGGLLLAAGPKDAGRKGLRSFTSLYAAPGEKRADGVGWAEPAFAPGTSLLHKAFRADRKS
uniref:molybdopterin-dependent oxidoreductase n=1 Tax=Desulfovibrio sp. TaxID=885 RepID=UPI00307713D3